MPPITWRNVAGGNFNDAAAFARQGSSDLKQGFNRIGTSIGDFAQSQQANTKRVEDENRQNLLNQISTLDQVGLDEANASGQFGIEALQKQGVGANDIASITRGLEQRGANLVSQQQTADDRAFKIGQRNRTLADQDRADSERTAGKVLDGLLLNNAGNDFGGNVKQFQELVKSDPSYLNASDKRRAGIIDEAATQFEQIRSMTEQQRGEYLNLQSQAQSNVSSLTEDHNQRLKALASANNLGTFTGNVEDQSVQAIIKDIDGRDDGEGLEVYGRVTEDLGFAPSGEVFRDIVAAGRNKGSRWFTTESGGLDEAIKEFRKKSGNTNLNKYLREKVKLDQSFTKNVDAANSVPSQFKSGSREFNRSGLNAPTAGSFDLASALLRTGNNATPAPTSTLATKSIPDNPIELEEVTEQSVLDLGKRVLDSGNTARNKSERDALRIYMKTRDEELQAILSNGDRNDPRLGEALSILDETPSNKNQRDALRLYERLNK